MTRQARPRVPADRRAQLAADMQTDYYAGSSIRNLARRHQLSYGTVHRLLGEVKTTLRPRGGARRRKPADD